MPYQKLEAGFEIANCLELGRRFLRLSGSAFPLLIGKAKHPQGKSSFYDPRTRRYGQVGGHGRGLGAPLPGEGARATQAGCGEGRAAVARQGPQGAGGSPRDLFRAPDGRGYAASRGPAPSREVTLSPLDRVSRDASAHAAPWPAIQHAPLPTDLPLVRAPTDDLVSWSRRYS
jgi:hypothetical protein